MKKLEKELIKSASKNLHPCSFGTWLPVSQSASQGFEMHSKYFKTKG